MTMRTGTLSWLAPILDDETLDPTSTLLLIALADHVDEHDECFVGIETLAKRARCSYGTARRRLAALEKAGRLTRERRRRGDGNLSTYTWRLIRPEPARTLRDDQRASGSAMTSAHPDARAEPPSGEPPSTEHAREPALFDDHAPPDDGTPFLMCDTLEESFARFWSVYPRKAAKGAARKAWPRAVKAAGPAGGWSVIVAGAERYRDDPNREDGFTAHPTTWLNAERWNDDPLPPRGAVGAQSRRPVDTDRSGTSGRVVL